MAYVPLSTVGSGDTITTAWGNQVKDNFAAGVPDIFTTKGDIAIASGADAAARLAVGSDFQITHAKATATLGIEYSSGVLSVATRAAAQSINDNSMTKVELSAATSDTYSMFDGTNFRLTVPVGFPTRYYIVSAAGYFAGHATADGSRQIEIRINGATHTRNSSVQSSGSLTCGLAVVTPPLAIAAGSYVEVWVYQNSGGALNWSDTQFGLSMIR